jgi:hypothetical protein
MQESDACPDIHKQRCRLGKQSRALSSFVNRYGSVRPPLWWPEAAPDEGPVPRLLTAVVMCKTESSASLGPFELYAIALVATVTIRAPKRKVCLRAGR